MNATEALEAIRHSTNWRKSSRSKAENDCVEVTEVDGWVGIRDSKLDAEAPIIVLTVADYRGLLAAVRTGAASAGPVQLRDAVEWRHYATGPAQTIWHVCDRETGVELHYTDGEKAAFLDAVRVGEMDITTDAVFPTGAPASRLTAAQPAR